VEHLDGAVEPVSKNEEIRNSKKIPVEKVEFGDLCVQLATTLERQDF
jgi:hypothetical protein